MIPEFKKYYREAFERAQQLAYGPKDGDYNAGGVVITHYSMWDGVKHWWDFMWHKILRLRSLFWSEKKPACEPIEDTLVDLINYTAFCYAELKMREAGSD